jgi:hypothetical protein
MNLIKYSAAALLFVMLIPSVGFAELRRVELKVLGMD